MTSLSAMQIASLARAAEEMGEPGVDVEVAGFRVTVHSAAPADELRDIALSREQTTILLALPRRTFHTPCKS